MEKCLICKNLNPFYLGMLYVKNDWNWSRGSSKLIDVWCVFYFTMLQLSPLWTNLNSLHKEWLEPSVIEFDRAAAEKMIFVMYYRLIWSAHQELKCHLDGRNIVISNWSSLKEFPLFFFWPRKKYCLEIMCRQTSWFYFYWGFPWIDLRGMANGGEISYWFVRLGERNLLVDDHDFQARRINKDPSHRWRDKDVLSDRAS